nr:hypothetical protein [bacterium]
MKKTMAVVLLLGALGLVFCGCGAQKQTSGLPDKVALSEDYPDPFASKYIPETVEKLVNQADLIVKANVLDNGTKYTSWDRQHTIGLPVLQFNLEVLEVLGGTEEVKAGDTIKVVQVGIWDTVETKYRQGETVISVLQYMSDEKLDGISAALVGVAMEMSHFRVLEDGRVQSFSKNPMVARFDGLQAGACSDEIARRLKPEKQRPVQQGGVQ